MKSRFLWIGILILSLIAYVIYQFNEALIIEKLSPYFPESEENPPGYYADLVSFLFTEAVWIVILFAASLYLTFNGKMNGNINAIESVMVKNSTVILVVSLFIFVVITSVVATLGLEQFPNSADEFAYLFQAEQLAEGRLWNEVHPLPDFFEFHHLAQKDDKWVSRFPPGWPLLLSLAFVMHIPPFLINTVLGVLAALVLFRLLRRIYDERIALWSTLAMLFSGFFIFNSATYFSHMASLLEGLLFVYFAYRFLQTRKNGYAIVAGIFLGMLVMTRQLTAIIFLVPFIVYFVYQMKWRALLPLTLIGLGALPFVGFFLYYNHQITGNALVPVTMWTNADEAIGFVKGHTPAKGVKFTVKRLAMFFYWASPSILILYFFYLLRRLKDYRKLIVHPEDYLFLLLIAGYFFYYHSGGNQYGPRFYLEGFPFLVAFVVAKALRTNQRWAKVFLFCALVYNVVKLPFITYRENQVVSERKDIYNQVAHKRISNAVIFISSGTGIMRPMPVEDLNRNDRYYKNGVIYARDLGDENVRLMNFYKGKDFYLYRRAENEVKGTLIRMIPGTFPPKGLTAEKD
jgi:hypothetical protein